MHKLIYAAFGALQSMRPSNSALRGGDFDNSILVSIGITGEMAERLKVPDSKSGTDSSFA